MSNNQNMSYYVGAIITSLIGGILLLATDFGGWYNYNYYAGVRSWGWVGAGDFPFNLLFIITAFCLFYCTIISFMALKNVDNPPSKKSIKLGIMLSLIVFILALIGGIVFILTLEGPTDWWLGEAFYGGLLGGLLTTVFLYFAYKNKSIVKTN
jgi:hypothetical protein